MTGRMARMKAALRSREELCALSDLYGSALSNGRNDVSVLKRRGWIIAAWWETHGKDAHKHYQLILEPTGQPKQMTLVGAA